jgi:hypothetical protein
MFEKVISILYLGFKIFFVVLGFELRAFYHLRTLYHFRTVYHFLFIYSNVHTLFGSFLPPCPLPPPPFASRQNLFCPYL